MFIEPSFTASTSGNYFCSLIAGLWLVHTARDREQDREREMMGFYITLCTVHTTQGQGRGQVTIVFYCVHPDLCPCPVPGLVQCV